MCPDVGTYWGCLSTLTLSILTLSRMTLSKVSFSDILRNDYLDHFDTFGENFDFDTFKNDTFEYDTFESVWVDRHPQDDECTMLSDFASAVFSIQTLLYCLLLIDQYELKVWRGLV